METLRSTRYLDGVVTPILLALTLALAIPGPAVAQQRPVLGGIVVDQATDLPVAGATISIEALDIEIESREDGSFGFIQVPVGRVSIRVAAPGRAVVRDDLEIGPEEEVAFVRFILPDLSAVLGGVIGEAERGESYPPNMTAAELVMEELPGADFRSFPPGATGSIASSQGTVRLRSTSSFQPDGEPVVFVDGVRIGTMALALDILRQIPASDVESVEILRGPAAAFLQALAANGAILVVTRSGPDDEREDATDPNN